MWDAVFSQFSPGELGPLALVSLPGHGPAPWFPRGDSFDDTLSALVEEVSRALPRPALLLGYSMGARIALGLWLKAPALFRGALLLGVDPGLSDQTARAQRRAWDAAQAARILSLGVEKFSEEWAALPLFATQATLPREVQEKQGHERREHTAEGLAWAMRALGLGNMPAYTEALAERTRFVRLLSGARDEKFSALGRSLAPRGLDHHTIEGAGHNLAIEAPAAVAASLRHSLQQLSSTQEPT
jgi:2-succinyl-6-hydroxy-2,4-cyclohexadiene-1-carboxylate synthase